MTVDELRADIKARRDMADKAFTAFKFRELVKELPKVELAHNSLPAIPNLVKPRGR